jgi:hypothetical protein
MNRREFLSKSSAIAAAASLALPRATAEIETVGLTHPHHVWETAAWLNVTRNRIVRSPNGPARLSPAAVGATGGTTIENSLVPCTVQVRNDGRFVFDTASGDSRFSIFQRSDPSACEAASREAFAALLTSFRTAR